MAGDRKLIKLFESLLVCISILILSACSRKTDEVFLLPVIGMANPASVYCQDNGYLGETRNSPDGGQYGVCIFSDGSECPEWEYYEGRCKPGDYETAPTPALHPPRFVDQEYGFFIEADCGYTGWENKVVFNCYDTGNPYSLTIGYGWKDERIQPLNFNDGIHDFQDAGTFKLLGQDIPKRILFVDGKVRQVAYGPNLEVDQLHLSIWLAGIEGDSGQFEVTQNMQTNAETILSTFSLLNEDRPEVKIIP